MKVLILFFLIWGSTEIFGCGLNLWDVGEDTLKKIGFAEEKLS
ncbi:MAG: hypothetical protein ABIK97_06445 [candidate division WOR-3 bacterium]